MKKIRYLFFNFLLLSSTNCFSQNFDVVFCLDLSASTNGVIDQFRADFWEIVNEIGSYNPKPNLRIGIVGFGSPVFEQKNSLIKIISDLDTDIDKVAYKIYNLKRETISNRGNTYVNKALATSIKQIKWSKDPNSVKILFLIGNGTVTNLGLNKDWVVDNLAKKNITVVPIYLSKDNYIKGYFDWQILSEDLGVPSELINLNKTELEEVNMREFEFNKHYNQTSVYYGKKGLHKYSNYIELDSLISFLSPQAIHSRISYKISDFYPKNYDWDLVDLISAKEVDISKLKKEYLAKSVSYLENQSILDLVNTKSVERAQLINKVYRFDKSVKYGREDGNYYNKETLRGIVMSTCKNQALTKGFTK